MILCTAYNAENGERSVRPPPGTHVTHACVGIVAPKGTAPAGRRQLKEKDHERS